MPLPIELSDGSKFARFDGKILEVSGISGSSNSKRLAINVIENVGTAEQAGEVMFVVRSKKGGFGLVISQGKKNEWEKLVQEIHTARLSLTEE